MGKKYVELSDIKKEIIEYIKKNTETELPVSIDEIKLSDILDSLSIVILVMEIEKKFDIEFQIEEFNKEETVSSLAEKFFNIWQNS